MARLSQRLNDMINQQISVELYNANVYSQVQSFFEDLELKNLSDFFKVKSEEERDHALRFMDFLNDRIGGKVRMLGVPPVEYDIMSVQEVGDLFLDLELETTARITAIVQTALDEDDHVTYKKLQWFMKEQYEEEATANQFKRKAELIKTDGDLLLWDSTFKSWL